MVETDRAVAFVMDDILLASLVAGSKTPDDYVISKDAFSSPSPTASCCARTTRRSRRWSMRQPPRSTRPARARRSTTSGSRAKIPPKGINLNTPISTELKHEFAKPSDSPNPDDYK